MALPSLKCHAGLSTRHMAAPSRAQWGSEAHVGAPELEAALKIIMDQMPPPGDRLESEQGGCTALGGSHRRGGRTRGARGHRGQRRAFQKTLPSRAFCSSASVPQVLGTPGAWVPSSPRGHPSACPSAPSQPSPPACGPWRRCLAAGSAAGLCHGDGSSCRRRAFVSICQSAALPAWPALREHFSPMALETGLLWGWEDWRGPEVLSVLHLRARLSPGSWLLPHSCYPTRGPTRHRLCTPHEPSLVLAAAL